jgi:hypothetical protein
LDDAFSSAESKLAQVTNRCAESDLELYICEVGEIMGINKTLAAQSATGEEASTSQRGRPQAKAVMEFVIQRLIEWKKSTGGIEGQVNILFFGYQFIAYVLRTNFSMRWTQM